LLDVQSLDTKIDQAAHRRERLPEAGRLSELTEQRVRSAEAVAQAQAEVGDIQRELTRVDDDVERAKARRERDKARLNAGSGQAKELVALQHEVEVLNRRLIALEDTELEVMERLEQGQHLVNVATSVVDKLDEEIARVGAGVEAAYAEIDAETQALRAERAAAVDGLDAGLVALYARLRAARGGVGAAPLRAKRCEGCRLVVNPADLEHIRTASPDEVIRCEECGRILVRLEDSGL
jgi:predicted  nucleic acid-binding Zn-ribbon protein